MKYYYVPLFALLQFCILFIQSLTINNVNSKTKRASLVLFKSKLEEDLGFENDSFKSGFITILGNPNVGKSTLINAILKEPLSIVSPKPQTTR